MRYQGTVEVSLIDKDGILVENITRNDITAYGIGLLFSNLIGQTSKKITNISLGYLDPIDCSKWKVPVPITFETAIAAPIFSSVILHTYGPDNIIIDGYNAVQYTMAFTVRENEANGESFNAIGLNLDDGYLFALTKIPKVIKTDHYNLVVKWVLSFIEEEGESITPEGFSLFAKNMIPGEAGGVIDSVQYLLDDVLVADGELSIQLGPVVYAEKEMQTTAALKTTIPLAGTYTCDKITVKAGTVTFAEIDLWGQEWTFTNLYDDKVQISNGASWTISVREETECAET